MKLSVYDPSLSQKSGRVPLKGKEKENFWRELLSILRPGEPRLNIRMGGPEHFDPEGHLHPTLGTHTHTQYCLP